MSDSIQTAIAIQTCDPKEPNRQALADLPSKRRSERTKRENTFPFARPDLKESNSQVLANLPLRTDSMDSNRKALSDLAMQTTIRPNQKGKHFPFCPSRSEGVKFASACEFATAEQIRWLQIGKHFPIWPCKRRSDRSKRESTFPFAIHAGDPNEPKRDDKDSKDGK